MNVDKKKEQHQLMNEQKERIINKTTIGANDKVKKKLTYDEVA